MAKFKGTGAGEAYIGTSGKDKIDGKGGDDELFGMGGKDDIKGGDGNDTLHGGDSDDKLKGEDGEDVLNGGAGKDDLKGGDGDDTLDGGIGDDKLDGGKGNDALAGGDGDDKLKGKDGDDTLDGGAGDDVMDGGKDNDVMDGGAGNDWMVGGKGEDTVLGGAGDDVIFGDEGGSGSGWMSGSGSGFKAGSGSGFGSGSGSGGFNDYLDGGAGDDIVIAGGGDDTAFYNVSENIGATDDYRGGSGIDTLKLDFTLEQWMDPAVQADIAAYLQFLAAHTGASGEADSAVFQFTAFNLSAREFENLEVCVDGVDLDPTDQAVTAIYDTAILNEDDTATSFGTVLGNDIVPDLVKSVVLISGPAEGILVFNPGIPGAVDGSYSFDPAGDFEDLAQGASRDVTFTYEVTDADDDTDQATVTITVTGTNDAPVITSDAAAAAGSVTEAGNLDDGTVVAGIPSATGTLTSSDVDTGATATWSIATDTSNTTNMGLMSLDSATGVWTYTVDQSASDYLAEGETATETFTASVTDDFGATDTETVTVTITGTNDAPLIDVAASDLAGAVTEAVVVIGAHVVAPAGLVFTDTSNILLSNAQVETGNDASSNPNVVNGNVGHIINYTASGLFNSFSAGGTYGAHNLNDGDIGTSPTNQDGLYAIPNAGANSLVLDLGGVQTISSIAIYNGYGNRSDGNYVLKDGAGTVLGGWTISGTHGGTNDGVHSFWLTFDVPVNTDKLVFDTTNAEGGHTTNSYREIQIFGEPTLTDTGVIVFTDVDLTDGHTVDPLIVASAGTLGALTANVSTAATSGTVGEITWDYSVTPGLVDYLAEGETKVETFEVTVVDSNGASDTETVTITITGSNDAPVVTSDAAAAAGTVTEAGNEDAGAIVLGTPEAGGQLTSADVDTGATATWSGDAAGTYGSFAVDAGTGAWTYKLDNADGATDALAEGQIEIETFTATVTDEHGATATQNVTVTVAGTNDSPVALDDTVTSGPVDAANWTYNSDNGHYYRVVDQGSTFAQAISGSDALGGYLATITSASEQAFIEANGLITQTTDGMWIGGQSSNPANSASWNWVTGPESGQSFGYSNWNPGEPNGGFGGTGYAQFFRDLGTWNDAPDSLLPGNGQADGYLVEWGGRPEDAGGLDEDTVLTIDAATLLANDSDVDTGAVLTVTAVSAQSAAGVPVSLSGTNITYDPTIVFDHLAAGESAADTFTYTVTDEFGATDTATVTLTVQGQNDGPAAAVDTNTGDAVTEAGVNPFNTPFAGDDTAIGNVLTNDTDVDTSDTLSVASVNGLPSNVGLAAQGTYGSVMIGSNGVYTYSLNDADPDTNALAQGEATTDVFTYEVSDGNGGTDTATLAINITGTNDAPIITDTLTPTPLTGATFGPGTVNYAAQAGFSGFPSSAMTVDFFARVSSPNNLDTYFSYASSAADNTVLIHTENSGLSIWINGQYRPLNTGTVLRDGDWHHVAVTIDANGGIGEAFIDGASIALFNFSPVTLGTGGTLVLGQDQDVIGGNFDGNQALNGAMSNTNVWNGIQTPAQIADAAQGIVNLNDPDLVRAYQFNPTSGAFEDASGNATDLTTNGTLPASTGPLALQIAAYEVVEDVSLSTTGTLLAADVDSGAVLTWSGDAAGTYGDITIDANTGAWTYTLNNAAANVQALALGESQTEIFTMTVTDEFDAIDTQDVTVTVTGTNDAPIAVDDTLGGDILFVSDSGVGSDIATVLINAGYDVDVVLDNFTNGSTPALSGDLSGYSAIYWSASGDGFGNQHTDTAMFANLTAFVSNGGRVFVTGYDSIASPSDPQLISFLGGTSSSDFGAPSTGTMGANSLTTGVIDIQGVQPTGYYGDTDTLYVDGGIGTQIVVGSSYGGTGASWSLRPLGTGEIAYVSNGIYGTSGSEDGWTDSSAGGNGAYNAALLNFAFAAQANGVALENEIVSIDTATLLANDTDVDLTDVLIVSNVVNDSGPSTVSLSGTTITYDPNGEFDYLAEGETATDTFTYTVDDGNGGTDTATVTIEIEGENDAPVANADSASLALSAPVDLTGFVLNPANGHYYRIVDGGYTFTQALAGASAMGGYLATITDAAENAFVQTLPTTSLYALFGASDAASEGTWTWIGGPEAGQTATYLPWAAGEPNNSGGIEDAIMVYLNAGLNGQWNDINDAPNSDMGYIVEVDPVVTGVDINVLANDTDVDNGAVLAVQSVDPTSAGGATVTINTNGTVHYEAGTAFAALAAGEVTTDTFSYVVTDEHGAIDTATVTVTVTGTNDAPVAVADTGSVSEDGPSIIIDLLGNDSDVDTLDLLSINSFDFTGLDGMVTDNGNGTVTYDPNGAFEALNTGDTATDSFSYTVSDGNGGTSTATVDVTVLGQDDVSVANLLVDFEDHSGGAIGSGYQGFNWQSGGFALDTLDGDSYPGSGYASAGTQVAYTPYAAKPVIITRSDASDFEFLSVELTSVFQASNTATWTGYNNGVVIGSETGTILQSGPTEFDVDWGAIDLLEINSTGDWLVLDNFEFFI